MTAPKNKNTTANLATKLSATLSTTDREFQTKAIDYVIQMAGLTNTNISKWDIFKLFGATPDTFITDKREINKRFLAHAKMNANVSTPVEAITELDNVPGLITEINKFGAGYVETQKAELKNNLQYAVENLMEAFTRVNNRLIDVVKYRSLLDAFDGKNPAEAMKKELSLVLADGSWTNPVSKDGVLYLNTKNDVIITHKNKLAGLDIQVNCGQLAVRIALHNLGMRVIPYKNNIGHNNYFHPHVDYEGNICWGNAGKQVAEWIKKCELSNILKMLYSLLFTYNESSPYIHIQNLSALGKKFSSTKGILRHPDKDKKPKEPEVVVPTQTPATTAQPLWTAVPFVPPTTHT